MIHHSVIFTLNASVDEATKEQFFGAAKELATIAGVENFKCLKQVSAKNKFSFGLSMDFADELLYQQYNNHPLHIKFIGEQWLNYVEDYMEIDYLSYM